MKNKNWKNFLIFSLVSVFLFGTQAMAEWKVDLSRRSKELRRKVLIDKEPKKQREGMLDALLNSDEPVHEIVILNTDKGFVPANIRVKEGWQYRVHVVNVVEDSKNVSFVLDSFSEFHSTYYGKIKSFYIKPKKSGVYSYQCPETSAQGRLVVVPKSGGPEIRLPASEQ